MTSISGNAYAGVNERAEGIHCKWETYPPDSCIRLFTIERVYGNGTVSRVTGDVEAAKAIKAFIEAELNKA